MPTAVLMRNMIIRQTILGNVRMVKRKVFPYVSSRMRSVYDRLSPMWEKSLSGNDDALRVYDRLPVCLTKIAYDTTCRPVLSLSSYRPPRGPFRPTRNILIRAWLYLSRSYHSKLASGSLSGWRVIIAGLCATNDGNLIKGGFRDR